MIIEKKYMSKLKDFGINSYESKVWVALLSRGVSTAGELSDIANVPRSRSYDVLESLEKKGFVVMKIGKPIKYIAVSPEEAIERVKQKINREAKDQEEILDDLKGSDLLSELTILHNQGIETQDPSELTGSIKGRTNVYNHLEYQLKLAKENVFIATTEQGLIRKASILKRQLKKAKDRGVKIIIAAPITDDNKKSADILSEFGDIKNINSDKSFCIIDNNQTTTILTDDKKVHPSYEMAVWIQSPYFAKTLMESV